MSWLVLLFTTLLALTCSSGDSMDTIVKATDKFTASVYKELAKNVTGNFHFSGLSTGIVLSSLVCGSEGETKTQLLTCLDLPENTTIETSSKKLIANLTASSEKLKLSFSNKYYLAGESSLTETFQNLLSDYFSSEVENVDCDDVETVATDVNNWVSNHTNEEIKSLINSTHLNNSTTSLLVNILYLSGYWAHPFESLKTKKRIFYTSENNSQLISSMYLETTAQYFHCKTLKVKFLELDLKEKNISMVFVLPDSNTGLSNIEKNMRKYLKKPKFKAAKVAITIPKFNIETKLDFKPLLETLGLTGIFTCNADLKNMSSDESFKIDFIYQGNVIEISELGILTESATIIDLSTTATQEAKYSFTADHPFFYYIRHKITGALLFVGRFIG